EPARARDPRRRQRAPRELGLPVDDARADLRRALRQAGLGALLDLGSAPDRLAPGLGALRGDALRAVLDRLAREEGRDADGGRRDRDPARIRRLRPGRGRDARQGLRLVKFVATGLSHKTAPIELREKLAQNTAQLEETLLSLRKGTLITEACVVSTCNRVEFY